MLTREAGASVDANVPDGRRAGGQPASGQLKVFLSYSRRDKAFAHELLAGLELLGFDAYLDVEDIAPGEPWEARLGSLIAMADTVVFVLSPNSLSSKHCSWEVEETTRAAKRLVPVIQAAVDNNAVPEQLRKLNYVYFSEGQSFTKALGELAKALRANAGWVREHTRLSELANRWSARSQPGALLLRGSDLEDAERWVAERPMHVPEITAAQQAYIAASRQALRDEQAATRRMRTSIVAGLAITSVVTAGLAAFSFMQWRTAELAKTQLADTNARLERRLALRAAPRGYQAYDVPAGWFQVATSFAGAVAFTERRVAPNAFTASGVLIEGHLLNPKWDKQPVFLTASYVIARDRSQHTIAMSPHEGAIVMLGPKNERRTAFLGAVLWQNNFLGVSVSKIDGEIPHDATPIRTLTSAPLALKDLRVYAAGDIDRLFDDRNLLISDRDLKPIAFIGNLAGRNEVALSISHLLGHMATEPRQSDMPQSVLTQGRSSQAIPNYRPGLPCATTSDPGCAPAAVPQTHDVVPTELPADVVKPDLVYAHGTLPGGGGSPIFDAVTGDLIGIHLMSYPCASVTPGMTNDRRCAAAGVSMPRILAAFAKGE